MDETFEALFRTFLDCLPTEWLAGQMHVTRVPRPEGGETLRVAVTHPKGKRGECGPSEKLLRQLGRFLSTAPPDWTSYHLKVRKKRAGGWDVKGEFRKDEAERAAAEAATGVDDWVANSRQMDFGARFLGTYTRLCVRKQRKVGWVLLESRWFLFIPFGTTTTKLGACSRIYTHWESSSGKHIIDLESPGRSSVRVYEGKSPARRNWLVETLQDLLLVPVEETRLISMRR